MKLMQHESIGDAVETLSRRYAETLERKLKAEQELEHAEAQGWTAAKLRAELKKKRSALRKRSRVDARLDTRNAKVQLEALAEEKHRCLVLG